LLLNRDSYLITNLIIIDLKFVRTIVRSLMQGLALYWPLTFFFLFLVYEVLIISYTFSPNPLERNEIFKDLLYPKLKI
jgi:hypothetical protein